MIHEHYINDALEIVSTWEMIPEQDFARAVNDQARLMAGQGLELRLDDDLPSPYAALRF